MIDFFNKKMTFLSSLVLSTVSSTFFLIALDYKNIDPREAFLLIVLFFSVSCYFSFDFSGGDSNGVSKEKGERRFIDLFVINIIIAAAIYSRASALNVTSHDYRAFLHSLP
jgi:hypothetical protein